MEEFYTCPSPCMFENHPAREHGDWARERVEDAISRWEKTGPTSLTVALMAEALYAIREVD